MLLLGDGPMTLNRRSLLALPLGAGLAAALPHRQPVSQPMVAEAAEIHLIRGLFGVFSLGLDTLADKLRALGYAPMLWNWTDVPQITSTIVDSHRRGSTAHIILVGHSLGSDAVVQVAQELKEAAVEVDLAITFDVTIDLVVPSNVEHFVNFYQHNGFGRPAGVVDGFAGEFRNVNLSDDTTIGHGNMEDSPKLQSYVVERVLGETNAHVQTKKPRRMASR